MSKLEKIAADFHAKGFSSFAETIVKTAESTRRPFVDVAKEVFAEFRREHEK